MGCSSRDGRVQKRVTSSRGSLSWSRVLACSSLLVAVSLDRTCRWCWRAPKPILLAEAFELVDEALRATDAQGERWSEAELHHVRARLLLARGQFDESEVHLWRSIEISRSQKARTFELR